MGAFYIKIMHFEFSSCSDPFLECQRFVNLAVHFISEEQSDTSKIQLIQMFLITFFLIFVTELQF